MPPTPEVAMLVHAFYCEEADCEVAKCRELKSVLERTARPTSIGASIGAPTAARIVACPRT